MSNIDDFMETGNKILSDVSKAVDTGDYSRLGDQIRVSVQSAVNKAKTNPSYNFQGRASAPRTTTYASGFSLKTPFFAGKISKSAGVGKIIGGLFGAIPFGMGALTGLILLIIGFAGGFESLAIAGAIVLPITGLITAFFSTLVSKGSKQNKLTGSYYKYGKILGNSEYFSIRDLARVAGEDEKLVLDRIKEMMKLGFFPFIKFDNAESTVMLTWRAFDQYEQAERSRLERESVNVAASMEQPVNNASTSGILEDGKNYLKTIRAINDQIPGDEMSDKLYKLESIMKKIFTQVEKKPECADDLRKFMNYYLPTTTKLLNAYVDLAKQPEAGENITKTKREIEDAMDVINAAFENLLDSLFQDMAWDISSDISVMKTMMAQDGLTESELFSASAQGAAYQEAPAQAVAQSTEENAQGIELKF
ncbi:MAG: hypothetical protein E7301_08005 [Butyrivibrio sp.]|nr:hypothetical protein [Butyrivibrio sp.]